MMAGLEMLVFYTPLVLYLTYKRWTASELKQEPEPKLWRPFEDSMTLIERMENVRWRMLGLTEQQSMDICQLIEVAKKQAFELKTLGRE